MPELRQVFRRGLVLALAGGTLALAACGSQEGPPEAAARSFYAAVSAEDWRAACALLAPATREALERSAGTPCPEALAAEDLPDADADAGAVHAASRFGTMAQARFGADTVFLGRFGPAGRSWRPGAPRCPDVPTTAGSRAADVRAVFVGYLVAIWLGLAHFVVIALRHA